MHSVSCHSLRSYQDHASVILILRLVCILSCQNVAWVCDPCSETCLHLVMSKCHKSGLWSLFWCLFVSCHVKMSHEYASVILALRLDCILSCQNVTLVSFCDDWSEACFYLVMSKCHMSMLLWYMFWLVSNLSCQNVMWVCIYDPYSDLFISLHVKYASVILVLRIVCILSCMLQWSLS